MKPAMGKLESVLFEQALTAFLYKNNCYLHLSFVQIASIFTTDTE